MLRVLLFVTFGVFCKCYIPDDCNSSLRLGNINYGVRSKRNSNDQSGKLVLEIGQKYYHPDKWVRFRNTPIEMAFDHDGNLFFTMVSAGSAVPMRLAMVRKGSRVARKVPGAALGQGCAVDTDGRVFFATSDGIYHYSRAQGFAKPYALRGEDVYEIFIDVKGYRYVVMSNFSVFSLKYDRSTVPFSRVPVADSIFVDFFGSILYLEGGYVHLLKRRSMKAIRLNVVGKDSLSQIAHDSYGNIYIAHSGGLAYSHSGSDSFFGVDKIVGGPTGIAFDKDGSFALGYRNVIYRFRPVNDAAS